MKRKRFLTATGMISLILLGLYVLYSLISYSEYLDKDNDNLNYFDTSNYNPEK